jgi:hypothetical protein
MPEPPESKDLLLVALMERSVAAEFSRLENSIRALLAAPRRSRVKDACVVVGCVVLAAAGGFAAGDRWGYRRGDEMHQVFVTKGAEEARYWLDLMIANPGIGNLEKRCMAGEFSHVTLANGEDICHPPLSLHPIRALPK